MEEITESITFAENEWEYELEDGKARILAYHGTEARVILPSVLEGMPVTEIGSGAFENQKMESVRLPSAMERIGSHAFRGCSELTRIKLTNKVNFIGEEAFAFCEKLEKIEFRGEAPVVEANAFQGINALAYHTAGKESWTDEIRQGYGGIITWRQYPALEVTNVASTGKPKLSWRAIEGAVAYKVYRATAKKGPYALLKTTEKTSLINVSAQPGESFFYKVKAIMADETEDTARSSAQQRTCDLPRPEVEITKSPAGNPKLTWEEIPGAQEYKVYRGSSEKGSYTRIKITDEDHYVDKQAKKGKTNYYYVVALAAKAAADSAPSKVVSIKLK